MLKGVYSHQNQILAQEGVQQLKEKYYEERQAMLQRSRRLQAETNRRRRAQANKRQQEARNEEKRREEILAKRREEQLRATNNYQRFFNRRQFRPGRTSPPVTRIHSFTPTLDEALATVNGGSLRPSAPRIQRNSHKTAADQYTANRRVWSATTHAVTPPNNSALRRSNSHLGVHRNAQYTTDRNQINNEMYTNSFNNYTNSRNLFHQQLDRQQQSMTKQHQATIHSFSNALMKELENDVEANDLHHSPDSLDADISQRSQQLLPNEHHHQLSQNQKFIPQRNNSVDSVDSLEAQNESNPVNEPPSGFIHDPNSVSTIPTYLSGPNASTMVSNHSSINPRNIVDSHYTAPTSSSNIAVVQPHIHNPPRSYANQIYENEAIQPAHLQQIYPHDLKLGNTNLEGLRFGEADPGNSHINYVNFNINSNSTTYKPISDTHASKKQLFNSPRLQYNPNHHHIFPYESLVSTPGGTEQSAHNKIANSEPESTHAKSDMSMSNISSTHTTNTTYTGITLPQNATHVAPTYGDRMTSNNQMPVSYQTPTSGKYVTSTGARPIISYTQNQTSNQAQQYQNGPHSTSSAANVNNKARPLSTFSMKQEYVSSTQTNDSSNKKLPQQNSSTSVNVMDTLLPENILKNETSETDSLEEVVLSEEESEPGEEEPTPKESKQETGHQSRPRVPQGILKYSGSSSNLSSLNGGASGNQLSVRVRARSAGAVRDSLEIARASLHSRAEEQLSQVKVKTVTEEKPAKKKSVHFASKLEQEEWDEMDHRVIKYRAENPEGDLESSPDPVAVRKTQVKGQRLFKRAASAGSSRSTAQTGTYTRSYMKRMSQQQKQTERDKVNQSNATSPPMVSFMKPPSGSASRIPVPSNQMKKPEQETCVLADQGKPAKTDSRAKYDATGLRLDRTPTDEEINWLWDKVRNVLHSRNVDEQDQGVVSNPKATGTSYSQARTRSGHTETPNQTTKKKISMEYLNTHSQKTADKTSLQLQANPRPPVGHATTTNMLSGRVISVPSPSNYSSKNKYAEPSFHPSRSQSSRYGNENQVKSALSLEEDKILASLDRLNQRLKNE